MIAVDPEKSDDAIVDLVDTLLRDGAVIRADVIVSVADVPLVGIKLSAAIAGMETMTEYGLFEEWDTDRRAAAVARRQYTEAGQPRGLAEVPVTYGGDGGHGDGSDGGPHGDGGGGDGPHGDGGGGDGPHGDGDGEGGD